MNFRPLHDRVMVKREDEEDVSKGGIIIPDTAKEKPMHAKKWKAGKIRNLKPGKWETWKTETRKKQTGN